MSPRSTAPAALLPLRGNVVSIRVPRGAVKSGGSIQISKESASPMRLHCLFDIEVVGIKENSFLLEQHEEN